MEHPDDLLQAVAVAMAGEDGCCRVWREDGRCCMTENAERVLAVALPRVLEDIAMCGLRAGSYTGVLHVYAKRNGIEFRHPDVADAWPKSAHRS